MIFDLIAILPFYVALLFPFHPRVVQFCRLCRIFMIFKLLRYYSTVDVIFSVLVKKKDYIFESDFCFSIKDDSFFYARELPEIQILPKEKDQPFFFQRRSRRFNELHDCDVHITFKNIQTPVKLIDFSENGADPERFHHARGRPPFSFSSKLRYSTIILFRS